MVAVLIGIAAAGGGAYFYGSGNEALTNLLSSKQGRS
jgi:hypothetical protein